MGPLRSRPHPGDLFINIYGVKSIYLVRIKPATTEKKEVGLFLHDEDDDGTWIAVRRSIDPKQTREILLRRHPWHLR
jgi:hypothetical protein